LIES